MINVKPRRFIGEALIEERLITQRQLDEGLRYQKKVNKLIGESLIELGYLKESTLLRFLTGFFYDYEMPVKTRTASVVDDIDQLSSSDLKKWLIFMVQKNASDMHLISGVPPQLRILGELVSTRLDPLSPDRIKGLVYGLLSPEERSALEQYKAIDKSFEIDNVSRYRLNIHWQQGSVALSVRALPIKIPSFEDLGIPIVLKELTARSSGLVLVTGPAGSGKSTTLAAMIEHINLTKSKNIVTIEDPIEYVFRSKKSLIRQRELGSDTLSFGEALRSVVRQDPNIILIGEMRDLETIQAALTLAETGHLILSTLHTQDASHAVSRIVDVFPLTHQLEVRTKLSCVLQGVVVQQLMPRLDKSGRVLATEVLNCTNPIKNLIRENNLSQIRSFIQIGGQYGMKSMNQSLLELYQQDLISMDDAESGSNDAAELMRLLLDS